MIEPATRYLSVTFLCYDIFDEKAKTKIIKECSDNKKHFRLTPYNSVLVGFLAGNPGAVYGGCSVFIKFIAIIQPSV